MSLKEKREAEKRRLATLLEQMPTIDAPEPAPVDGTIEEVLAATEPAPAPREPAPRRKSSRKPAEPTPEAPTPAPAIAKEPPAAPVSVPRTLEQVQWERFDLLRTCAGAKLDAEIAKEYLDLYKLYCE